MNKEIQEEVKNTICTNYHISTAELHDFMFELGCVFAEKYASNLDGTRNEEVARAMMADKYFWKWYRYSYVNHDKIMLEKDIDISDYFTWKRYEFIEKSKFLVWWSEEVIY